MHPQVNGRILECMDQNDDIREYLTDQAGMSLFIQRLLTWLKPFQGDSMERKPDIDVSHVFASNYLGFAVLMMRLSFLLVRLPY